MRLNNFRLIRSITLSLNGFKYYFQIKGVGMQVKPYDTNYYHLRIISYIIRVCNI